MSRDDDHPRESLSAWLDGEVTPEERWRVEAHLADCAACRDLVQDLREMAASLGSEKVPPPPASLEGRIRWRLRSEQKSWRRRVRRALPAGAIASLAAAGLLVAFLIADRGPLTRHAPLPPREAKETAPASPETAPPPVGAVPSPVTAGEEPRSPLSSESRTVRTPSPARERGGKRAAAVAETEGDAAPPGSPPAASAQPPERAAFASAGEDEEAAPPNGAVSDRWKEEETAAEPGSTAAGRSSVAPSLAAKREALPVRRVLSQPPCADGTRGGALARRADAGGVGALDEELRSVAYRLGGSYRSVQGLADEREIEVPVDRWDELASALGALGYDLSPTPPDRAATCVRVRLRLAT